MAEGDWMGWRWMRVLVVGVLLIAGGPIATDVLGDDGTVDASGQWSMITLEPNWRNGGVVGTAGSMAMIAGGSAFDGKKSYVHDLVYVYDGATHQWSTDHLSQARRVAASATVGSQILFAGGTLDDVVKASNVVDIYDTATRQWSTARLSEARERMSAITVGSRVVFAGGDTGYLSDVSSAVDVYDSETGTWSTATLSEARSSPTAVVVGSQVVFAGGSARGYSDAVDIFDTATGQWSAARLSQARSTPTTAIVGSQALFVGGLPDLSAGGVDIYDSATRQWSSTRLAGVGGRARIVVSGSRALIPAGSSAGSHEVYIYDSDSGQWSHVTLVEESVGASATAVVGTRLLTNVEGRLVIFDSATLLWSTVPVPEERFSIAAGSVGTTAIFLSRPPAEKRVGPIDALPATISDVMVADVYETTTGQWTSHALSASRGRFTLATVGTQVVIAGGSNYPPRFRSQMLHTDAVDIYDAATGIWSAGKLALARETPRATTLGTQMLFTGGILGCTGCPVDYLDAVAEVYDSAPGR